MSRQQAANTGIGADQEVKASLEPHMDLYQLFMVAIQAEQE